jgi:hypothetical protein
VSFTGEIEISVVTHYTVYARRWERGWELHIGGVGVTQTHDLAEAEDTVRSYVATARGDDPATVTVDIVSEIGDGFG